MLPIFALVLVLISIRFSDLEHVVIAETFKVITASGSCPPS